jgi:hypothetical protein
MSANLEIKAAGGECSATASFRKVSKANPAYTLKEAGDKGANWTNQE